MCRTSNWLHWNAAVQIEPYQEQPDRINSVITTGMVLFFINSTPVKSSNIISEGIIIMASLRTINCHMAIRMWFRTTIIFYRFIIFKWNAKRFNEKKYVKNNWPIYNKLLYLFAWIFFFHFLQEFWACLMACKIRNHF